MLRARRALVAGVLGGGVPITNVLLDQFTTDRAAGAVNGTNSDGVGALTTKRVVTDAASNFVIDLGLLQIAGGGGSNWTANNYHYTDADGNGFARANGKTLQFDVWSGDSTLQFMVGWSRAAAPALADTEHMIYFGGSATVYARNNQTNTSLGAYSTGIKYRVRIQLQAAGAKFYMSGGRFGLFDRVYTLVHTDNALSAATLWPVVIVHSAPSRFDNFQIPITTPASNTTALDTDLQTTINNYQAVATLITAGGLESADWTQAATMTNKTVIMRSYAMRQDTTIRKIKVNVATKDGTAGVADGTAWKFKLFRWNGTTYTFVAEESFTPNNTGTFEYTLGTPLACTMADTPGLFIPENNSVQAGNARGSSTPNCASAAGDIGVDNAFATTEATNINMEVQGYRPFLAITGDSIPEGHNDATNFHSVLHDAGAAVPRIPGSIEGLANNPGSRIRAKIGNGTVLQYQNYALGSQTFAWVASTGIVKALSVSPSAVLVICGLNDIITSRTWAAVEADLDTIAGALSGETLFICEIFPTTNLTDEQCATRRTWNTNLAAWCTANGAYLVSGLDSVLGMLNETTGQLDDRFTYYNHTDNVHLKTAGVDALADAIVSKLIDVLG